MWYIYFCFGYILDNILGKNHPTENPNPAEETILASLYI